MQNELLRRLGFTVVFLIIVVESIYAQSRTLINGNFPKFKDTIVSLSYSYSDEDGEIIYAPDTKMQDGKFEIVLSINTPRWVSIEINNENLFRKNAPGQFTTIVIPSDSIVLDIHDYGLANINASGKGSSKFNYVKELIHERLINSRGRAPLNESITDYLNYIGKNLNRDEAIAKKFQTELSDDEYKILLANSYVQLFNLVTKRLVERDLSSDEQILAKKFILDSERFKFLMELNPNYTHAIDGTYYTILSEVAFLDRIISIGRRFTPEEAGDFVLKYNLIKDYFKAYKIRDNILGKLLVVKLRRNNVDSDLDLCVKDFLTHADRNNKFYRRVKDLKEQSLNNLAKGSIIENYSFIDTLGNKKFLSDFVGTVTIVDFWFNGCYGCALITPKLNEIKEYFKGHDVTFVSINIDKDRKTWVKAIGKFAPLHAIHLNTNFQGQRHPMIDYFQITVMPTLVILDKKGRIFNQRATPPTLPKTKNKLITEIEEALSL